MPQISSSIVEVCIFKFEQNQPHFLLLHRNPAESVYPNLWQMVTGSIEKGEKAYEAALREMAEETGLKPAAFWVVPHVSVFYDHRWDSVNHCPMFAAQVQVGSHPVLSQEHDDCVWLPRAEAEKRLVWPGQREGLKIVHDYIIKDEKTAGLIKIL